MPHKNDYKEMLVSGHTGSKKHKRGKSLRQKRRDRHLRRRAELTARRITSRGAPGEGGMTS